MAARGRKQKVCLLKQNLGDTADTHYRKNHKEEAKL
jgi:hypothetical protein